MTFAQASDLESIKTLADSCPFTVLPQLLDILQSLPETLSIHEIAALIKKVESSMKHSFSSSKQLPGLLPCEQPLYEEELSHTNLPVPAYTGFMAGV